MTDEIGQIKKSKVRFTHTLPFRCNDLMHAKMVAKINRLGLDSVSSYLRQLVDRDMKLDDLRNK